MDYLREGIHLRGFAQIEPIIAYKNDGFEMFKGLINSIWEEFARFIFHVEVEVDGQNGGNGGAPEQAPAGGWAVGGGSSSSSTGAYSYAGGGENQPSALAAAAAGELPDGVTPEEFEAPVQVETRKLSEEEQIGRNDPCWCGSGKKYKKCHGA
jgi:preprotein translocase subunit SecA